MTIANAFYLPRHLLPRELDQRRAAEPLPVQQTAPFE